MESNKFIKKYTSKIPPMYIPIPEFKFYHGASSEDKVDSKFIGREGIIRRLKSWLADGVTDTGVYLVTGFRGMGKSSFVGKVLNEITKPNWIPKLTHAFKFVIFVLCLFIVFFMVSFHIDSYQSNIDTSLLEYYKEQKISPLFSLFFCISTILILLMILFPFINKTKKIKRKFPILNYLDNFKRIVINLNLGHETLNERDILSLISNSIEYEYKKYISGKGVNWWYISIKWILISVLSCVGSPFILNIFERIYVNVIAVKQSNTLCKIIISIQDEICSYNLFIIISLMFLFFWFLWKFVGKLISKFFPNNPSAIYNRLHDLNQRIVSSTNEEITPSNVVTSIFGITINRRRNRSYPIADVREIEQRLSWILNEIAESGTNAPKFIIVFDELDKIDPSSNHQLDKIPEITPEFENTGSGFTGGASSRKRKQNLLKMLANMKYFISTAKAKFIFIAGRELYDAYLADASDREFAVGSIFNNTIYVNSFLSREQAVKDVVAMTEEFICRQLLPSWNLKIKSKNKKITIKDFLSGYEHHFEKDEDYYTLKTYNILLKEFLKIDDKWRNRTIIMLYQFTVYLSYVSNGAPKKISNYFEKYIETKKQVDKKDKERDISRLNIIDKNPEYYLSFNYRTQQKIGFIHYLAFPVINAILNNASRYGDKLLISACFLTNHIYKYHNSGFSWRNLENIPELLDINKSPDTRQFIDIIISFLKRSHISTTINSLYHFKFPMRISEEISLMSRLSEEVSALFNFTLDDSLSLKRHYSKMLQYYSAIQNNTVQNNIITQSNDLHHVIVGIHQILGDLHALDEEYNEAIFEYQSCISLLLKEYEEKEDNERNNNPHYLSHILNIVRIMLKLSLMHEKRKTYNTAYVTYNELIALLTKFRYINQNELGLSYKQKIIYESTWKDREDIVFWDDKKHRANKEMKKRFHDNVQAEIEDEGYSKLHYKAKIEELIPELHRQLSPEKNTLANRLSLFEDVSLVYQALLARLFVLEKTGLSGITKENVDIVEFDFLCLQRAVYYKEKYMIAADFFRKLADILYYKNGLINSKSCNFFMSLYLYDYNLEEDLYEYFIKNGYDNHKEIVKILELPFKEDDKGIYIEIEEDEEIIKFIESFRKRLEKRGIKFRRENQKLIFDNNYDFKRVYGCTGRRKKLMEGYDSTYYSDIRVKDKRKPCYACKYYSRSLKIMKEKMVQSDDGYIDHPFTKSIFFIEKLSEKESFRSLKKNDILTLAASLDGMGNTMFSCSDEKDKIRKSFIDYFVKLIGRDIHDEESQKISLNMDASEEELSYIEKALSYYWAAAAYFKYSANIKEALECYKKILHVFESYLIIHQNGEKKDKELTDNLLIISKLVFKKAAYLLYMQYENTNMVEVQKLKWIFTKQLYESVSLNLLSDFPDIEEMVIIICSIEQLCGQTELAAHLYKSMPLSSYRIENTITERIVALRLKANVNLKILYKLLNCNENINYEAKFPQIFYENYFSYLTEKTLIERLGKECYAHFFYNKKEIEEDERSRPNAPNSIIDTDVYIEKIELVEFLIMDTIFALSKIVETISPTVQTTLFTESYMGGIYIQLFECNQMCDFIHMMYKWCDITKRKETCYPQKSCEPLKCGMIDKSVICSKIRNFINDRLYENKKDDLSAIFMGSRINLSKIANRIKSSLDKIKKRDKLPNENYSEIFFKNVMKYIDKSDIQNNRTNYLLDMALQKYKRSIQMHHEGSAHQELMSNMYFLEDDLSNNTFQFYFAIERYFNNCGLLNERIKKLKKVRNVSSLFKIESYSQDGEELMTST